MSKLHVAIIMDGNGRWANARGLPRIAGHRTSFSLEAAFWEQFRRIATARGLSLEDFIEQMIKVRTCQLLGIRFVITRGLQRPPLTHPPSYPALMHRFALMLARYRDVERLARYEGPRYRIAPLKVRIDGVMTTVAVFAPLEERFQPTSGDWNLVAWQRRYKRAFIARVKPALRAISVR